MTALSFPQFTTLDTLHFVDHLDRLLQFNLDQIAAILAREDHFTWDNLMRLLDDMDDSLERFWSPLSHLHAVANSKALRDCYQACLPKLSAYEAAIAHNHALYTAIKSIKREGLDAAQIKILDDTLRDFILSGVALSDEKKHRFEAIQTRLSELSNQFENNILDATQAFSLHITDKNKLSGLPEHALETAAELAASNNLEGWMLNLEFPCYYAVISYADDRELRETMYQAYVTRASDQGPNAGQFDNSSLMNEILALRHEKALLLGFTNYAELSLATKMAESSTEVTGFMHDLVKRGRQQAQQEFQALKGFSAEQLSLDELKPWDMSYASEKNRQALFTLSQEDLRPYFPLPKVMTGLLSIINTLYGMTLTEEKGVDVWHKDVKCYAISDEENQVRGYIYMDLFARSQKRGGAWMDSLQSRRKLVDGTIQLPIATLTCNFAKPSANKVAMLSHDEIQTLLHELGHCLHHILTKVDYLSASGINGVEWDAVELPSQFFENWGWEKDALDVLTAHVDTNKPLPEDVFEKLIAAKNFQSSMAMMRQLEFSIFDFRIHQEYKKEQPEFASQILSEVRQQTSIVPQAPYNRFQHSFSHIFAGGYAAGYYSYKWAEVLSCDAFSRFEEEGIFNKKTGRDFLHTILEVGGSKPASDNFANFRGRQATIDALLRHNGIK